MAEFLIFMKNAGKKTPGPGHWMDDLTPDDVATKILRMGHRFQNMYDERHQPGDIILIGENGEYAPNHFNRAAFVVVRVTDLPVAQAKHYRNRWRRDVAVQKITNDTVNHVYDYKFTVIQVGTSLEDRFSVFKDKIDRDSVPDISILSRSPTEVVLRLEPVGTEEQKLRRVQRVEATGKEILGFLRKTIRSRRYAILTDNLPQAIKDKLKTDGWVAVTKAQVQNYLLDKANL